MGLRVMETKQTNFDKDFAFGEVAIAKPASGEDMLEGIDVWVGGIPFAWRRYRVSVRQYGEISIRYSRLSGAKTEYDKLLDGDFKAQIYLFQFTDACVICRTADIIACLKEKRYILKYNKDKTTSAVYVNLDAIKHLILQK